jgi:hypothetical protein
MLVLKTALLLLLQILVGFGILEALRYRGRLLGTISLAAIIGNSLSTFGMFLLELANVTITLGSIFGITVAFATLAYVFVKQRIARIKELFSGITWPKPYEFLVLALAFFIIVPSIWRAYYLPVDPHDSIVGPDLIAKYAVEQGHYVSSPFTDSWIATFHRGQMFYAPFTAMMQIQYRLLGYPFGQVWLGILWISFLLFFYDRMRDSIHPMLAGLLLVFFLALPEVYAYTFLLQTDFSNMVFFCSGVFLFWDYVRQKSWPSLLLSALLFGLAVWSRSEGVFFVGFGGLLVLALGWRELKLKSLFHAVAFVAVPTVFFVLWNIVFFKLYLPYPPDNTQELITQFDYSPRLFKIYESMLETVIFKDMYWGFFIYGFLVYLVANLIIYRDAKGLSILAWVLLLFIVFGLIIFHFPLANVPFTFRRGYFKFFPIFLFYAANSSLMLMLSKRIDNWERRL